MRRWRRGAATEGARRPVRALRSAPRGAPALAAAIVIVTAVLVSALVGAAPAPARAIDYGDGAPIPALLFPASNPWNTPVDTLPLDPNSADYIAHMSPGIGLHPDFGTVWEGARIGIPYIVVPGTQAKVPVHFVEYGDESDPGPYPIPANAPIEGTGGAYEDGDRHVLVLDADNQMLYELYHASRQADGSWRAGSGAVFDLASNALRADGWTSADAAGLSILPGLARYDEIVAEGVLDHALRFTVARTQRAYVYPATHFASSSTDADLPPMGLRLRLRADFAVGGFPAEVQTILRGLKKYGMMVADNGADWYVGGAPDPRWDDAALHSLERVKGSDFEVVDSRALLPSAFSVSLPAVAMAREGTPWSCTGGFFDGAGASWTATVDYDSAVGGAGPAPPTLGAAGAGSFVLRQTWPDDGSHMVRVVVSSDLGESAAGTTMVSVRNVAPTIMSGGGAKLRSGSRFTRTCSFTDPGADGWKGWVEFGDGSARQALRLRADKTFHLSHRYGAQPGRRCTVTLRVTDDDGGRDTARIGVTLR